MFSEDGRVIGDGLSFDKLRIGFGLAWLGLAWLGLLIMSLLFISQVFIEGIGCRALYHVTAYSVLS
ncbi:MAG: hypothetical protein Q8N30_09140 [Methylococcales bacterium]|nr:hypothetical protein [Methylococcales bacterium]